ncbi:MAG: TVP38/TMEM64 family protein [Caulobacteraceae bacterium]
MPVAPVKPLNWKRALLALVVFGGAALALVIGSQVLGPGGGEAARRWLALARGPWALPAAIGAFSVLAFVGAPQFALIAAAVAVLGPFDGALTSWVATMVSAVVGFELGRLGEAPRKEMGGTRLDRLGKLIARNGLWASLVIRLVPFAPFVLVNMAAGATGMGLLPFLAGTGLGVIPKIAAIALAGGLASAAARGTSGPVFLAFLAAALLAWVLAAAAARLWARRRPPKP